MPESRRAGYAWADAQLAYLGELLRGVSYGADDVRLHPAIGYSPVLRATNIQDGCLNLLTELVYVRNERIAENQRLCCGDIVIAMSSGSKAIVGKAAQLKENWAGSFGAFCAAYRVNSDAADPSFIGHVFHTDRFREHISRSARGTNINNLTKEHILGFDFPLPPIEEQRMIARSLTTMKRAQEVCQHELRLERERKAALLEHLFKHGTRRGEQETTEVGPLPAAWSVVTLGEVAEITYGIQAAVAHLTDPTSGIPILTNVNIRNDGRLDFTTLRYFPLPERLRERGLLKKGDVLFNWRSGSQDHVGKTALFEEQREFTYSSFILRLRPCDKVRSPFLSYYLHAIKARGYFAQNRQQSSVNSVFNASVAAAIPVGLPKLEVQDEITAVLKASDCKIAALEKEDELIDELFRAMLEELMTGRVSTPLLIEERQAQ